MSLGASHEPDCVRKQEGAFVKAREATVGMPSRAFVERSLKARYREVVTGRSFESGSQSDRATRFRWSSATLGCCNRQRAGRASEGLPGEMALSGHAGYLHRMVQGGDEHGFAGFE